MTERKARKLVTISRQDLRDALFRGLKHGTTRHGLHVHCADHTPRVRPMSATRKIRCEELHIEPHMRHKQATVIMVTLVALGVASWAAEHYCGINADVCYAVASASLASPLANLLADV